LERAEQLARSLDDISRRQSPDGSSNVLTQPVHAWWHLSHDRYDQAAAMFRAGLPHCRRILGEDHPFTFLTMRGLARALQGTDVQDEKEQLYRAAWAGLRRIRGDLHWQTIAAELDLAAHLSERGKSEEAEAMYRELVVSNTKAHGEEGGLTLQTMESLAYLLAKGDAFAAPRVATERLAELYERWNRPEQAAHGRDLTKGRVAAQQHSPGRTLPDNGP